MLGFGRCLFFFLKFIKFQEKRPVRIFSLLAARFHIQLSVLCGAGMYDLDILVLQCRSEFHLWSPFSGFHAFASWAPSRSTIGAGVLAFKTMFLEVWISLHDESPLNRVGRFNSGVSDDFKLPYGLSSSREKVL